MLLASLAACALAVEADRVAELVRQAGNADDEATRLELLRKLQALPGLDAELKAEADRMVAGVERWLGSKRLDYFGREVSRTRDLDFKVRKDSPLYPLTCLYRARMLVWVTLESGGIIGNEDLRRQFLDKAVELLTVARAAFPDNRIVRMYLGEPLPAPKQYPAAEGAPEWAALQRENLERLADIIVWWIEHRMQPDGQYGGGWGDDCEMWRWWVPVLIGFDDPKIAAAQARFSNALMGLPHMKGGYTTSVYDVEHTAEDSADVITPMMHLEPDSPLWKARALRLAELMETLWTARNQRGFLQFKSTYFSVAKVDEPPQRACDTVYHPRAVQPALLLWQRSGDKRLGELFTSWLDTWVDAAARAERGKPAGIIPSAIHWPDGAIGGLAPEWWDPRNHSEAGLYRWPSAMPMMADSLLLAWHMSRNEKYLQPLRTMAAIRFKWLTGPPKEAGDPGSEAWCAERLGFLARTLAKHKLLSGTGEFDELLGRDSRALAPFGSEQARAALVAGLRDSAEALRVNFPGYTSEVRYTDRVLRFPALFGKNMMFRNAIPAIKTPNPSLLYSAVTGDPGDCGYFPLAAVRWLTQPRDIAALVTARGTSHLTAELFHFGDAPRPMAAELYLLTPGRYTREVAQADSGAAVGQPLAFTVSGPRTRVAFNLPPRKPCSLRIRGQAAHTKGLE
jgi:hypothetical protein